MPGRNLMRRTFLTAAVVLGLALPLAPVAHADPHRASARATCPEPATSQALTAFGDSGAYYLVDGGSFTGDTSAWQTTGDVHVAPDSEPYDVMHAGGGSLAVGQGGRAASAPMCTTGAFDRARLFYRGTGRPGSTLNVSITSRSGIGRGSSYTITYRLDGSSSEWRLSPTMVIPDWTDASGTQQTTITVSAEGGSFQVDDVVVDPWRFQTT